MRPEILVLAFAVGVCNWAFRYFPTRANLHELPPGSRLSRFLAATGPAAIGTLFVASALPMVRSASGPAGLILAVGVGAVCAVFALTRSAVGATVAGAVAYGLAFWALGGAQP